MTLPLVPGTEAAGAIVAAGPGVDAGLVGRPVVHFGHLAGVYAELTAVPLDYVVPLPPDTPLDLAAAVALSGTTAYVLTSSAHQVGPGDVVVVHAAAGATGGAVVQRAAAAGADVIAIASTPRESGGRHHARRRARHRGAGNTRPGRRRDVGQRRAGRGHRVRRHRP